MGKTALVLVMFATVAAAQSRFVWKDHGDGRLELLEQGKPALTYNYGPRLAEGAPEDRRRCCYIFPVFTPRGVEVLDDFPKDHWHHRGLFWAWPVVRTAEGTFDLWALKGVEDWFERFRGVRAEAAKARVAVENAWYAGGRKIVTERATITVFPAAAGARELEVELTLEAQGAPVTLAGSQEQGKSYGGFSARFAPRTGTLLRADGVTLTADEDLNPHNWAELEAKFEGGRAVLGITPDAHNPGMPWQWCLRNYGFVGASFPGKSAKVREHTLESGIPETLRFRVRVADVD